MHPRRVMLGFSTEFCSFAIRFNFTKASRFICSFIWEYFLKTFSLA
jgi:hypothetical protein